VLLSPILPRVGDEMNQSNGAESRGIPHELPYRFGDFELQEEIARGAMGVVFKARQLSLDRMVAIKLVLASWLATEEQAQRFQIEARASASLQHPSIVPLYEIGTHAGQHYLCLAYVDSHPLSTRLEEGPIPHHEAALLIREVASAIQHAHDHDVLHRDIKPANILIDRVGHPWVTDFGLAKVQGEDSQVTGTGESVGTPSYMSPEQAAGEVVGIGPGTDVYSIGATLYALLAGRPPFIAPSAIATLRLVQDRDPIPLRTLDPAIPRDLDTICARCLEKSANKRYASAAALADDLGRFLDGDPIEARPVSSFEKLWRLTARYPVASFLVALLVFVTCISGAILLNQEQTVDKALRAEEIAESSRMESRLQALGTADPHAFHAVVDELDFDDPALLDRLYAIEEDPSTPEQLRSRVRLAILDRRPSGLTEVALLLPKLGDRPNEFELVLRTLVAALDTVPPEYSAPALEALAQRVEAGGEGEESLLAALSLAACAPGHPAWLALVEPLALWLADTDPFVLPAFAEPLRPFPRPLLEELCHLPLSGDASRRRAATSLLAIYGTSEPELLADLLPLADEFQHRILSTALEEVPGVVAERMRAALAEEASPLQVAATPPVDAALHEVFLTAHGRLAGSWAQCLDMPLSTFQATSDALRVEGYRPTKVRPYLREGEVAVAAIFARDGRDWSLEWDEVDPESASSGNIRPNELIPVDHASYAVAGNQKSENHDVLVLASAEPGVREWNLLSGQTAGELVRSADALINRGLHPVSLQINHDEGGVLLADSVWHLSSEPGEYEMPLGLSPTDLASYTYAGLCQVEVDATRMNTTTQVCSGIWRSDPVYETRLVWEATLDAHVLAVRDLPAEGFIPSATSVVWGSGGKAVRTATVWRRPVPSATERVASARRRARAAATLVGLGDLESVTPLLRTGEDPSLRFALAFDLARLAIDPTPLLAEIEVDHPTDIRFAMLLALGLTPAKRFDSNQLEEFMATVARLARLDPDAGVHSLANWILATRKSGDAVESESGPAKARWRRSTEAHTLVRLDGPVEFLMGSPGWIPGRASSETRRLFHLKNSYEIGTTEVTQAHMRHFFEDHPEWKKGVMPGEGTMPVQGVTWFRAVAYCRWLSEVEGIPETQMCYPPLELIGPEMVLEEGVLERTGYRLPTEAEWEYACRAGTRSFYSFGNDAALLPEFANTFGPTDVGLPGTGTRPVGLRLPNDFGLFDMHGNVQEWCHDQLRFYRVLGPFFIPSNQDERERLVQNPMRAIRGGWFESAAQNMSSAARRRGRAEVVSRGLGFRIARTVR
jgi:serine/threonine protein kinase/formylglycine-generating enzyme required for sulfatase activity